MTQNHANGGALGRARRLGHACRGVTSVWTSVVLLLVLAPAAVGQIKDATPWYASILEDATPVRCGDIRHFYKVAELRAGQIVRVDGAGGDWIRVAYPGDLTAFVDAADVNVEGDEARLARPSKLMAANLRSGPSGSWKPLFSDPVDAGTRVRIVERLEEADGRVYYRIVAPAGARGYMLRSQVREATPQEVEDHLKVAPEAASEQIENREAAEYIARDEQPVQPGSREEIEQAASDATRDEVSGENTDVLGLGDADESLLEPITPVESDRSETTSPEEVVPNEPAQSDPVTRETTTNDSWSPPATPPASDPNDEFQPAFRSPGSTNRPVVEGETHRQVVRGPDVTNPAQRAPVRDSQARDTGNTGPDAPVRIDQSSGDATQRPLLTPSELEVKFQQVFRQREDAAEYDELISEYQRTLGAMGADPSNARLRSQLERRLTWLEIKSDHRRMTLELQQASQSEALAQQNLDTRIQRLNQSRTYTVVGRLVPSTVYDGKRLPLMYRVMTVGSHAPRTIGYLRPDDANDLRAKVGHVVGILGEATLDTSLKLNIIRPDEVDVLGATTIAGETTDIDQ